MPFDQELYNKSPYHINLQITFYCPHGCWYCNQGKSYTLPKETIIDLIGEKEYIRKILNMAGGLQVQYSLFGGEPLAHPSAVSISKAILEAGHRIDFQTNGTMIERLAPLKKYKERIHFNASFHIGAYSGARMKQYILDVIPKLLETGSPVYLNVVCVPTILNKGLANLLRLIPGVKFRFIEFYGPYDNKQYPMAYSNAEKEEVNSLRNEFNHDYCGSEELSIVNNRLYLKGLKCIHQTKLLRVNPHGVVSRCSIKLGNIAEGDFAFQEGSAKGCGSDVCGCVSMGYANCLKPNGISLKQYLEIRKDMYATQQI